MKKFLSEIDKFSNAIRSVSKVLEDVDIAGLSEPAKCCYNDEAIAIVVGLRKVDVRNVDAASAEHVVKRVFTESFFPEFVELVSWRSIAETVAKKYSARMNELV